VSRSKYQVYSAGAGWYGVIYGGGSLKDTSKGFAGWYGQAIRGLKIDALNSDQCYRIWLPATTSFPNGTPYDYVGGSGNFTDDPTYGYAGDCKNNIGRIEVYTADSSMQMKVHYIGDAQNEAGWKTVNPVGVAGVPVPGLGWKLDSGASGRVIDCIWFS
jgi:hypothetical protein